MFEYVIVYVYGRSYTTYEKALRITEHTEIKIIKTELNVDR